MRPLFLFSQPPLPCLKRNHGDLEIGSAKAKASPDHSHSWFPIGFTSGPRIGLGCGRIRAHSGPFGPIRAHSGPFGAHSGPIRAPFGPIRAPFGAQLRFGPYSRVEPADRWSLNRSSYISSNDHDKWLSAIYIRILHKKTRFMKKKKRLRH